VRAIGVLYALTGCLDAPGGNVLFASVPTNRVDGMEFLTADQRAGALGLAKHPLGPARFEFVTGPDFYDAALGGQAHALVNFGANLVMAHADSSRGRDALAALDFFVHADLFMSPTAELADIVLPATSPFETEALRIGFAISQAAQSLVQLRTRLIPPRGEARSDLQIIFELAVRLGLGGQFFGGDIEAAWRYQLAPSGLTLEQLRADPAGVRVPLTTRHRKYADAGGFRTPTRKIELYSEAFQAAGYPPLPTFTEPGTSPRSRPDLAKQFPLVLTCAKSLWFCESQHRNIASLRESASDPQVEIHPTTAGTRGVAAGDWVRIVTPHGSVRARAKLNANLDPSVVSGQHGWWQPCPELELPGFPPYAADSANLNLVLRAGPSDPVSRAAPLRASMCEITRL
jgi:anaerobic selenocysteine-containing dehydrogenase